MRALSAPPPDSNGVGDRSQARMCGEPSSPTDRARSRRRRRCASSRRISDLSVNAPRRPHRRCSASNLCGRGNFARSGCRSAAGGEAVDDVLGAVTAIPLIWGSDGRLERNRKFVDSPLEETGLEPLVPLENGEALLRAARDRFPVCPANCEINVGLGVRIHLPPAVSQQTFGSSQDDHRFPR